MLRKFSANSKSHYPSFSLKCRRWDFKGTSSRTTATRPLFLSPLFGQDCFCLYLHLQLHCVQISPIMSTAGDTSYDMFTEESRRNAMQTIVAGRKSWKTMKGRGAEPVWPPELECALIEGNPR